MSKIVELVKADNAALGDVTVAQNRLRAVQDTLRSTESTMLDLRKQIQAKKSALLSTTDLGMREKFAEELGKMLDDVQALEATVHKLRSEQGTAMSLVTKAQAERSRTLGQLHAYVDKITGDDQPHDRL